jgi:hypothetical protein
MFHLSQSPIQFRSAEEVIEISIEKTFPLRLQPFVGSPNPKEVFLASCCLRPFHVLAGDSVENIVVGYLKLA